MRILGIETSCDETAASVVEDGVKILSNVVASSADIHEKYGGVFPEIASRKQLESIDLVIQEAMEKAGVSAEMIDAIAVASGPGLIGPLLVGMNMAKGLSIAWNKPLIGINHVEAHLYGAMMGKVVPSFPALGICLSGGHTFVVKIDQIGSYEPIGTTVDDAIGEAFDKVATLLGYPYPGGPWIEKLALKGDPKAYPFKVGRVKKNPIDFSFSGLKTAVLYALEKPHKKEDLAASFQRIAIQSVIEKIGLSLELHQVKALVFGGGVTMNQRLQEEVKKNFSSIPTFFPPLELCRDNAAMIAGLAAKKYGKEDHFLDLIAEPKMAGKTLSKSSLI